MVNQGCCSFLVQAMVGSAETTGTGFLWVKKKSHQPMVTVPDSRVAYQLKITKDRQFFLEKRGPTEHSGYPIWRTVVEDSERWVISVALLPLFFISYLNHQKDSPKGISSTCCC